MSPWKPTRGFWLIAIVTAVLAFVAGYGITWLGY